MPASGSRNQSGALSLSLGATLAGKALPLAGAPLWFLLPLAGMAAAARLEASFPDRALALRLCAALATAGFIAAPWVEGLGGSLSLLALGGAAAALPAAVLRAAPEMERAPASSACWSALALGAGAGALLGLG
jgi:hypothetical protein